MLSKYINNCQYKQLGRFFPGNIKVATKLYFMHYSCLVIILFSTDLYKSIFPTCFSKKNYFYVFRLSVFFVCTVLNSISSSQTFNNCLINIYVTTCSVILFSYKLLAKTEKLALEKTCCQRSFEFLKNISFIKNKGGASTSMVNDSFILELYLGYFLFGISITYTFIAEIKNKIRTSFKLLVSKNARICRLKRPQVMDRLL